jgi:hypothetical protein
MRIHPFLPAGYLPGLVALALALAAPAVSAAESVLGADTAFQKLKGLAGEWHGTIDARDSGKQATVIYKVTSGGNAVIETLFPGTDHEMLTVYHLDGKRLVLTHYCTVGNQPRMVLARTSTPERLAFDFAGGSNINPKRDKHMHSMRLLFESNNSVVSEWDLFVDGKKQGTTRFYITRKA